MLRTSSLSRQAHPESEARLGCMPLSQVLLGYFQYHLCRAHPSRPHRLPCSASNTKHQIFPQSEYDHRSGTFPDAPSIMIASPYAFPPYTKRTIRPIRSTQLNASSQPFTAPVAYPAPRSAANPPYTTSPHDAQSAFTIATLLSSDVYTVTSQA